MEHFFNTYGNLILQLILNAILALSLYIPMMTGQLSLASPGFYALGGYVAAILSTGPWKQDSATYPLAWVLAEMILAALGAGILAILIGVPVLRLRGIYLALATIAFVEVVRVLALTMNITGGATGIFAIPRPFIKQIEFLWLAAPLLILTLIGLYRLKRTRTGRAFDAIRSDELAAGAMGINPAFYKVLAFVFSAMLAAMVGVIAAHSLNTWNTRQGTFDAGVNYLTFVLLGGSRVLLGPVIGAWVLTALPEFLRFLGNRDVLPAWLTTFLVDGRIMLYGTLIVLGTVFFPQGWLRPKRRPRRQP